ncbi:hypothetical protein LB505_003538 [Fusarium chuoi]|nr:hypothetical protein LB505_003538 [Fusarium chuoi]
MASFSLIKPWNPCMNSIARTRFRIQTATTVPANTAVKGPHRGPFISCCHLASLQNFQNYQLKDKAAENHMVSNLHEVEIAGNLDETTADLGAERHDIGKNK